MCHYSLSVIQIDQNVHLYLYLLYVYEQGAPVKNNPIEKKCVF